MGKYVAVRLDARATALAATFYAISNFGEYVVDAGWDWDSARAWTVVPADLCEAEMPDPGWGFWERLPRMPSQAEIDACFCFGNRWVVDRVRALDSGCVLFDDPIQRGHSVEVVDQDLLVEPFDDRHYLLRADEVTEDAVWALSDHCCMEWAGGAVLGSLLEGQAAPGPGLIEHMEAFVFNGFDGEAMVIVTRDSAPPSLRM
jgi:hypothetical protein